MAQTVWTGTIPTTLPNLPSPLAQGRAAQSSSANVSFRPQASSQRHQSYHKPSKMGKRYLYTFTTVTVPLQPRLFVSPQARLAPFLKIWNLITKDTWVLSIVQFFYCLKFTKFPPIGHIKRTSYAPALEEEILSLLQKQAIQHMPSHDILNGFYSRYFAVPKKDGGIRPILDLRLLNPYLRSRRFRMVTLESIIHLL